jgi:Ca2+-transporting ATPase
MYEQILLQSVYQIIIILPFHFLGVQILGSELTSVNDTIVQTVVFNTFVFAAQIFNSVNSLRLDLMVSNWYSMVITIAGELSLSPFELLS